MLNPSLTQQSPWSLESHSVHLKVNMWQGLVAHGAVGEPQGIKKYLHRTGSSDTGFMGAFCSSTPRWNTLKGWNEPRGLCLAMVTDNAEHCGDKDNIFVICCVTSLFAIIQNFPHFGKGWICIARWKSWESEIFWGKYSQ